MNKKLMKIGCLIAIAGLALIIVSFALFGITIWLAVDANEALSAPLELNKAITTELIEVDTDKNCMISVIIDFKSDSVQEEDDFDEIEYKLRYRFPVSYKILDAEGKTIFEETETAGWKEQNNYTSTHHKEVDANGGNAVIEHYFTKFRIPLPGMIKVEIEVKPDSQYGAEAQNLELKIYDNVSKHGERMAGACCAVVLGPIVFFAGIILLFVGAASK